jgi:post-segregation antitoxin (ccd killing protein)
VRINGVMLDNQTKPKDRVNVGIDADLHHRLRVAAATLGVKVKDLAEEAIAAHLAAVSSQREAGRLVRNAARRAQPALREG